MKIVISLLVFTFLLSAQQIFAHGDHGHGPSPISDIDARSIGTKTAKNLTLRDAGLGFGKLSASWASIPIKNTAMHKKGTGYYIIAVSNTNENKALYVLMSHTGEVYDANFSGEFNGLK